RRRDVLEGPGHPGPARRRRRAARGVRLAQRAGGDAARRARAVPGARVPRRGRRLPGLLCGVLRAAAGQRAVPDRRVALRRADGRARGHPGPAVRGDRVGRGRAPGRPVRRPRRARARRAAVRGGLRAVRRRDRARPGLPHPLPARDAAHRHRGGRRLLRPRRGDGGRPAAEPVRHGQRGRHLRAADRRGVRDLGAALRPGRGWGLPHGVGAHGPRRAGDGGRRWHRRPGARRPGPRSRDDRRDRMTTQLTRERTHSWTDPAETAAAALAVDGLTFLRALAAGEIPPAPIATTLGMTLEEVDEGRVVFGLAPAEFHYNPIGSVHGGVYATVLDSACGCAVHSTLPAGARYTSLDLTVRFLRGLDVAVGPVRCEGRVLHSGRRTALAEARLTDSAGRLYAHATSTCLVLRKL